MNQASLNACSILIVSIALGCASAATAQGDVDRRTEGDRLKAMRVADKKAATRAAIEIGHGIFGNWRMGTYRGMTRQEREVAIPLLVSALDDAKNQQISAVILSRLDEEAAPAVPKLIGLIDNKDIETRRSAISAITSVGPLAFRAVPRLRRYLVESRTETDKRYAITALGCIGPPAILAVPDFCKIMEDRKAPIDLRCAAAVGLGRLMHGPRSAVRWKTRRVLLGPIGRIAAPALGRILDREKEVKLLRSAVDALDWIGAEAEAAIPSMERLVRTGPAELRSKTLSALGDLGEQAGPVLGRLIPTLDKSEKFHALFSIRDAGESARTEARVVARCLRVEDDEVRRGALCALDEFRSVDKEILDDVLPMLDSRTPVIRAYAVEVLAHFKEGARVAVPKLLKLLEDDDDYVVSCAIDALLAIQPEHEGLRARFGKLLKSDLDSAKEKAIRVCLRLGVEADVVEPALEDLLQSEGKWTRVGACRIVASLKPRPRKLVELAVQSLSHSDEQVREYAAEAIGDMGVADEFVIAALKGCLTDPECRVQCKACIALSKLDRKDETWRRSMRAQFEDHDNRYRWTTLIDRLREVPEEIPRFREDLERIIQDDEVTARFTATLALMESDAKRRPQFVAVARWGLNHPDKDMLSAARRVISEKLRDRELALDLLIPALNHERHFVRIRVAETLGEMGQKEELVSARLAKLLLDAKFARREYAAYALGKMGRLARSVFPALKKGVLEQDRELSRQCCFAIGRIGGASAEAILAKAAKGEREYTRRSASEALDALKRARMR